MDNVTKQALQKAHIIEGEEESSFMERIKNTHWVVQIISVLIVVYVLELKTTCDASKLPIGCLTWFNKGVVVVIVFFFLWLFGKIKTKSVARKLSRIECWHVLNHVIKDYLTKMGYIDETYDYDIHGLRGVDWVEGNAPVYHYELNIKTPLGKKDKYLIRMQSQDTDTSIAGNIISCEAVEHRITGDESKFVEYLIDRKYAKAMKMHLFKQAAQKDYIEE